MRIQAIEANNYKNQNSSVSFSGKIGRKLIAQVTNGTPLEVKDVFNSMRKPIGMSRSKIRDVIESFVSYINRITQENKEMRTQIKDLGGEISRQKRVRASVRAIDELDVPTPLNTIKTIKEMSEHAIDARKSLYTYLTTGTGEEEALKQIERNMVLHRASNNGILNLAPVKAELEKNGFADARSQTKFVLDFMTDSLSAAPEKLNLYSSAVREQVRINAMALFNPIIKNDTYTTKGTYNDMLTSAINSAIDKIAAVDKKKELWADKIVADNFIPFDYKGSNVVVNVNGKEKAFSYPQFGFISELK